MSHEGGDDSRYSFPTRRSVLRTLGVGSTLAAAGGLTVADSHSDEGEDNGDDGKEAGKGRDGAEGASAGGDCPPCIDDLMGYASLSIDLDVPEALQPDHTVEMHLDDADVLFPEEGDVDGLPEGPSLDPEDGEGPAVAEEVESFPDFYFDPVGLAVTAGDVVEFPNLSEGEHTVSAIHPRFFGLPQRIPEGASPFSSPPVMPEENWLYRFDETGVYDLFCIPHFELGMVVRIVVTGKGADCPIPEAPEPSEGLPPTVSAVLDADALDPANIVDAGSVAWTDLKGEVPTFSPDELFGEEA